MIKAGKFKGLNNLIYIAVISFIACGQSPEEQSISYELRDYVEVIKERVGGFTNTDIIFGDTVEIGVRGKCYEGLGINIIVILESKFQDIGIENGKYKILLHEIGHCVAGLPHNDKLRDDGCPVSIMHPTTTTYECIDKYIDEWFDEIKKGIEARGAF